MRGTRSRACACACGGIERDATTALCKGCVSTKATSVHVPIMCLCLSAAPTGLNRTDSTVSAPHVNVCSGSLLQQSSTRGAHVSGVPVMHACYCTALQVPVIAPHNQGSMCDEGCAPWCEMVFQRMERELRDVC